MLPRATQPVTITAPLGALSMLAILSLPIEWAPAEATLQTATHTAAEISRFIIVSFVWFRLNTFIVLPGHCRRAWMCARLLPRWTRVAQRRRARRHQESGGSPVPAGTRRSADARAANRVRWESERWLRPLARPSAGRRWWSANGPLPHAGACVRRSPLAARG